MTLIVPVLILAGLAIQIITFAKILVILHRPTTAEINGFLKVQVLSKFLEI